MNITISYSLYIACMAALLEQDVHETVLGVSTRKWTEARHELQAAMLREVSRAFDESIPALCRKQAG